MDSTLQRHNTRRFECRKLRAVCYSVIATTSFLPCPSDAAYWTVYEGDCSVTNTGDCVRSPQYPFNYDDDSTCVIGVSSSEWSDKQIEVKAFRTETVMDTLTVNGVDYHGFDGPDGVVPSGSISWTADNSASHSGWELCAQPRAWESFATTSSSGDGGTLALTDLVQYAGYAGLGFIVVAAALKIYRRRRRRKVEAEEADSSSSSSEDDAGEGAEDSEDSKSPSQRGPFVIGRLRKRSAEGKLRGLQKAPKATSIGKDRLCEVLVEKARDKRKAKEMEEARAELAKVPNITENYGDREAKKIMEEVVARCKKAGLPMSEVRAAERKLEELRGAPKRTHSSLQGWSVTHVSDEIELEQLSRLLYVPDPHNLGRGRDVKEKEKYNDLELLHAWKIEKPTKRLIYNAKKNQLQETLASLSMEVPQIACKLEDAACDCVGLDDAVNEQLLLHGTKPENIVTILQNGLNERFSSGLFGSGVYLAEDPSKIDQYCTPDDEANSDVAADVRLLHDTLYDEVPHPGRCFYAFGVRVSLGFPVYTKDGEYDSMNSSESVWATSDKRELSAIPGSTPKVHYQSLIAECGKGEEYKVKRHREFISFDGDKTILEYLLAYRRVSGTCDPTLEEDSLDGVEDAADLEERAESEGSDDNAQGNAILVESSLK